MVCNCLRDFGLNKGLDDWDKLRAKFRQVLERFAEHQAVTLNVHGEWDLPARLARPAQMGKTKIAGIKLEQRIMRLSEVLLRRAGGSFGGWTSVQARATLLDTFNLKPADYTLNAVRYVAPTDYWIECHTPIVIV